MERMALPPGQQQVASTPALSQLWQQRVRAPPQATSPSAPTYQAQTQPAAAGISTHRPTTGACAENGSCYGDISSLTGRPKTVAVGGYYRKNGTYVRGYYRSRK